VRKQEEEAAERKEARRRNEKLKLQAERQAKAEVD